MEFFIFNNFLSNVRKRKKEFEEEVDDFQRKRRKLFIKDDNEEIFSVNLVSSAVEIMRLGKTNKDQRRPNVNREIGKVWWRNVYAN